LVEDEEATRSMVQKAVVAICTKPIYGVVRAILSSYTRAYFAMGLFADRTLLESFYFNINHRLGRVSIETRDELIYRGTAEVFCLIEQVLIFRAY
jgi:hypothetical protein